MRDGYKDSAEIEARDEEFVRLLMRSQKSLYGFILGLTCNWSDAEDVMQETISFIWRKRREFEPGSNFLAWARTIARYKVLEFRRARPQEAELSNDVLQSIESHVSELSSSFDPKSISLERCLRKLRKVDRNLVELRYTDGLKVKEIADVVGRPILGLYKAMSRIHRVLLECIERDLNKEEGVL